MKNFKLISLPALAAALFSAAPRAQAQTIILTPTTLSAAIGDSKAHTMVVTSATGFVANTTVAVIDREMVAVEAVSGTTITIRRGASGTVATTHANSALVFVGSPVAFAPATTTRVDQSGNPAGSCTRGSLLYLPVINLRTATISDCIGGQWQSGSPFNSGAQQASRFHVLSPDPGSVALTTINTNGTAVGATTLYCSEVFLPSNKLLTGIGVLNGTTVTANARYVILYDSAGNAISNSALAGQASVTASVYENYAFTAKYFAIGPAQYFACLQDNAVGSTTVRMVVTSLGDHILTKGQTGATFGTVPALTVPTTFTTAVGPWVYLY